MKHHYDLAVIGGGSGGFAAALSAARAGLTVLLVEKGAWLGGTSTLGGVNCWEPGVGGTGIPFELYQRLQAIPGAVGIYSIGRHFCWQDGWYWPHALEKVNFPGGETVIDPQRRYADTLRRHPEPGQRADEAFCRQTRHGVVFEPESLSRVMLEMLAETGRCTVLLRTAFTGVECVNGRVQRVRLSRNRQVEAAYWVDATGDGALCLACGAEHYRGIDPRSRFNEPGAPETGSDRVNGVTLMFRVTPNAPQLKQNDVDRPRKRGTTNGHAPSANAPVCCTAFRRQHTLEGVGVTPGVTPATEPLPRGIPAACWWAPHFPPICCNAYPNGDRSINLLPAMEGREFLQLGYAKALRECRRRVRAQWRFLQAHFPEFRGFRIAWIAPMLGVRESNRIAAEYMLTENDIALGLSRQTLPDIVAIADHALDRHGEDGGCPEVAEPYGIPYRSLIPRGFRNLLVACRAAGFSSIAASSTRLSRTLLQLGQAAGTAVALARAKGVDLPDVPYCELRNALRAQHVQLEWPTPPEVNKYVSGANPLERVTPPNPHS